jgi:hypothetical protein
MAFSCPSEKWEIIPEIACLYKISSLSLVLSTDLYLTLFSENIFIRDNMKNIFKHIKVCQIFDENTVGMSINIKAFVLG